jgi:hypothetical protein
LNTAQLGSAEVIAEAPSSGNGNVLPLSNFGSVNFTSATADNAPIGNENPDSLTLVSGSNVTEATPSALTGGNAFTVTWNSDGATATATPAPSATATATPAPADTAPAPDPSATATAAGGTGGTGGSSGQHHHRYWWWATDAGTPGD